MKRFMAAVLATALGASSTYAASVDGASFASSTGDVKVRHEGKVIPGSDGMALSDGDIVTVVGKGEAVIAYGGCQVKIPSGATAMVGPALCPPKTTGQNSDDKDKLGAGPLLLGGALVVGGIVAAVASSNSSGASH